MEKDTKYWQAHKQAYTEVIDELDLEIADKVMKNPNGPEGKEINKKVEVRIKELLNS